MAQSIQSDGITQLIQQAKSDAGRQEELFSRLYPELKALARSRIRRTGGLHTLDTTALANESYLKLAHQGGVQSANRAEFFAYVGRVMRSIVIDYVREQGAQKRGGEFERVTLDTFVADSIVADVPIESIDDALKELKVMDQRLYEVVEMHFFAGMTFEEIADVLNVSDRTVKRDWQKARGLLQAILSV
jgi:RNA polymerase sigma factor (TIGR02999 family)